MSILDTIKGMFGGKASETASGAVDRASNAADGATGGKASGTITGAADKAKKAMGDASGAAE